TWRLLGYGPDSPRGADFDALVTDRSDASGTSYWSPTSGSYDLDLFELAFGRPAREAGSEAISGVVVLPRVLAPSESAGTTVAVAGIPAGIVVGPGMGDNAGAGLGLDATVGDVVISIGTSGTAFAVTDLPTTDPSGTVAGFADATGAYLPLVATLNAARILTAVETLLGVDHDEFARLALAAVPGAGGVVLVPYFEGERTPNLPDATATLAGLTLAGSTRENLARAAVEGLICSLADGMDAVRSLGVSASRVLIVGGAALNPAVQAVAAQVFDVPVSIPAPGEYVADGAARQAAWVLTGARPTWPLSIEATLDVDPHPEVRERYRAAQGLGSVGRA
ncbi:MAG: xylulose kinase, partial [Frondihabitans sp.]|nr:xylulose kinase [Frondihabitans sp.]